ncbi:MAG: DUF3800 domain-containing protein [Rhodospirillaceae bacterium]|nr:DUF3800 domain-containing protein [Rhodospirillaceae bacterium]
MTAVFQAYMDESGIHDGAPYLTVAAYLATPQDWQEFIPEWEFMNFPIKVFHSADCNARQREFDGWTKGLRDDHVRNLLNVIADRPLAGCVVGLDLVEFEATIKHHSELRGMFGSPYNACFSWVVQTILDIANKLSKGKRLPIAFFHESNDHETEAHDAFAWMKKNLDTNDVLGSLTFDSKKSLVPLQAADILAYEGYRFMQNPEKPRPSWEALKPRQKIISLRYGASNMHQLVLALSDIRDGKIAVEGQFLAPGDAERMFKSKNK